MTDLERESGAGPVTPDADDVIAESTAAGVAELQAQLAEAQRQAAEYLDNWRRSAAEISNARKRMQREQDELRALAAERVLEKILPVADDLDRAFETIPADLTIAGQEWVNGFRAIQRKLQGVLESEGATLIQTAGGKFDPNLHYAVTHEEADGHADGDIIAELRRGYRLGERVLRPSMVRVAKG